MEETKQTAVVAQSPKRGGSWKLWLALIAIIVLGAVACGAAIGLRMMKRAEFLRGASSVCTDAAQIDKQFADVLNSPQSVSDAVAKQSAEAAKKLDELEYGLYKKTPPSDLSRARDALCLALVEHRKAYEAINAGDAAAATQAIRSASEGYQQVDKELIPSAASLPGLTVDQVAAGLGRARRPRQIAELPAQPKPIVPETAPVQAPPPTPNVTSVKPPTPAPRPPVITPKPVVVKKAAAIAPAKPRRIAKAPKAHKTARQAVYKCPYCRAWFIKASLVQRHKKFCINRPGGPARRARH